MLHQLLSLIALGFVAGALSGMTGIGGGVVIVPALVYLFGFSTHTAEGTTLAMLAPPIGFVAAWNFYQKGYVSISAALALALGFVIGSAMSSKMAVCLSPVALRHFFAIFLGAVAAGMFMQG
jgi:uncharacterized membrane protein YfcA